MRTKRILILTGLLLAATIAILKILSSGKEVSVSVLETRVMKGNFENKVVVSGELMSENSVAITIPREILSGKVRVFDIKITDLVEEGTLVDSGDFVASLDHSAIMERITEAETQLLEHYDNLANAKMDTNLNLSSARNNLLTDADEVEEKRIILEQSIYESPAVQRQAQMDLERAIRRKEQNLRGYDLSVRQAEQRIAQLQGYIKRTKAEIEEFTQIFESLNIKAPKKGMVIYARDRFGSKLVVGSMVNRWRPTIAELPDLSSLVSKTYVNEVDISRIKTGQEVTVGIDAFPEKQLSGEVLSVSNIGQTAPDKNTKVFEVIIRLNESDPLLRPAMTTSNAIITDSLTNVLYVPIDAVRANDSLFYVFPAGNDVKQIVWPGIENENYMVIKQGLSEGDKLLYLPREKEATMPFEGTEIYKAMVAEQDSTQTSL